MKSVVSLSGGMDSATVLAEVVERRGKGNTIAVAFSYGSKHNVYENECACRLADHYQVQLIKMDWGGIAKHFRSNLLLSGGDIPEGHYQEESMTQTVVPARNLIFASVLAGVAWSLEAEDVWLGIHSGDHAIYPDCRPDFFHAMRRAVELGTDERVTLEAPFLMDDKSGILIRGYSLGVPYGMTRTCYKDQPMACGKCGACQERLEAFARIGRTDPIEYVS